MKSLSRASKGRLTRQARARDAKTAVAHQLYGGLTVADYRGLLRDLEEARSTGRELAAKAVKKGSKLASLLDDEGAWWWAFYELPFVHHVALGCVLLGWSDKLRQAAATDNPSREFLKLVAEDDEAEDDSFDKLPRDQQAAFFNLMIGMLYSMDAVRIFGLSMNELVEKAKNGDQDALLDAAGIDRCVLATWTGAQIVSSAQLARDKQFFLRLGKKIRGPRLSREPYGDLRFLHRILDEIGALRKSSNEELWTLIGEQLRMYSTKKGDPMKALMELFRNWRQDATR